MKATTRILTTLALSLGLSGGAAASVELVGNSPFLGYAWGQQSDETSPIYVQNFSAPGNATLESIRWWGFHLPDSGGSKSDNFIVYLDNVKQSGTLAVESFESYYQYTLDIADIALTASSLSIVNESPDVQWSWQSTSAQGNDTAPDDTAVAFSLIGRTNTQTPGTPIPEPGSLSLLLLAAAALGFGKRRRA